MEPAFLFSMWACLFANAATHKYSATQLEARKDRMETFMRQYFKEHGFWPHPGPVVKHAMQ
jgi:hypothetical protein